MVLGRPLRPARAVGRRLPARLSRASNIPSATSGVFSTNFSATENPISQGGIWDNGLDVGLDWQNVQTTGSGAFAATATVNNYDVATALIKPSYITFNANQ